MVLAGFLLGLLVQYLFIHQVVGVNLLVAIAAAATLGLLFRRRSLERADALLAAALAFAAFGAIRSEVAVLVFDLIASTTLLLAWAVPLRSALPAVLSGAVRAYAEAAPAVRGSVRSPRPLRYGAGAMLAVPFLALFTALFSSADAVFERSVRELFDLAWLRDMDVGWRIVLASAVAWCATGVLAWLRREAPPPSSPRRWLASDTAVAALVVIDALFVAFAALQVTYLFGGRDTVDAAGMPYSWYARWVLFVVVLVCCIVC
jgi:hypothetical protein